MPRFFLADTEIHLPEEGTLVDALQKAVKELGYAPESLRHNGEAITSDLLDALEDDERINVTATRFGGGGASEATGGGGGVASEDGSPPAASTTFQIEVTLNSGERTLFKVKSSTKLAKLFKAFNEKMGVKPMTYRYLLEGKRVEETGADTVGDWQMEDGDRIDAMAQQHGGGGLDEELDDPMDVDDM